MYLTECVLQVRISVGPDICHRGCAYTVLETVRRHVVHRERRKAIFTYSLDNNGTRVQFLHSDVSDRSFGFCKKYLIHIVCAAGRRVSITWNVSPARRKGIYHYVSG